MILESLPRMRALARRAIIAVALLSFACGAESQPEERSNIGGPVVDPDIAPRSMQFPLQDAPCMIHVDGIGDVDIEEDYIPNVVACENGNAPTEALKAQAIQARGYIYYKLFVAGADSVVNSQADQVYRCDHATAQERHFEAARATRGEYLAWNDEIIATFYVAGSIPSNQDDGAPDDACQGAGGNDPTDTEKWVTYNQDRTGCNIDMTPLGWVPDDCHGNPQNRGCASQNGQACLANRGWTYDQMLPYYYGADIVLEQAGGECGGPVDEPSAYDEYCTGEDDGWSCFDSSQRVDCAAGDAAAVDTCSYGCEDDECADPVEEAETACADAEDGWLCLGPSWRAQCEGGGVESTQLCTAGCHDGECVATGQAPRPDRDDPPAEEFGLFTTSPGISGGCRQAGAAANLPTLALSALLLLTLLGASRRRRNHFVP